MQQAAIRPSQKFHYISADLKNPSEGERILSEATSWNDGQPPDIVWNCAGSGRPGLFTEIPIEVFRDQMDTNYMSSVYIAHAALRAWLAPPKSTTNPASFSPEPRHIIFTSSVLAFYPLVGYTPYTPAKAALRTLSDTLSQELQLYSSHPTAIKTHCIFPSTIYTDALEVEKETKPAVTLKLEESDNGQMPDEVAVACVRGLERGEEMITTNGLIGYLMKVGMLGSSIRNGWGILDTMTGWLASVVLIFVRWDMDRTVKNWGKGGRAGAVQKATEG